MARRGEEKCAVGGCCVCAYRWEVLEGEDSNALRARSAGLSFFVLCSCSTVSGRFFGMIEFEF